MHLSVLSADSANQISNAPRILIGHTMPMIPSFGCYLEIEDL